MDNVGQLTFSKKQHCRKSVKREGHYLCNVNGINRKDIGRSNSIEKLNCNAVKLNHYGNGIADGDHIRMFHPIPYVLLVDGIYKDGIIDIGGVL